jgi:hypothetical protein
MTTAHGGLNVWDVVDTAFRFTRHHLLQVVIVAGPAVVAIEALDYGIGAIERALGLSDPNTPVPWLIWVPLHVSYLLCVTFLLAIASIALVEMALGLTAHTRAYLRVDPRSLRLWLALFAAWIATFLVTAALQTGADLFVGRLMQINFDIGYAMVSSPWYPLFFWALHFALMVAVLARLSFLAPPVAVLEDRRVLRRAMRLCRGRFWRILMIAGAVEAPFILAFLIVPLPFHGVLGFGAESVFENGILVTAPEVSPLLALLKHLLDGTLGLFETATFTAAAAIAYRDLRPELEFE